MLFWVIPTIIFLREKVKYLEWIIDVSRTEIISKIAESRKKVIHSRDKIIEWIRKEKRIWRELVEITCQYKNSVDDILRYWIILEII